MAITNKNTGTFTQRTITSSGDRSGVEAGTRLGSTLYKIDLRYRAFNETEHIKWCRRNLGNRHETWDFWLVSGVLYIEVWGEKAKFAYELWKN